MSKIVSIHSFRGGTGKSNTTANICYLLAKSGKKCCVVDTDIQSPGIHILMQVSEPSGKTLNDFLWGGADIEETAIDVSANLDLVPGSIHLVPCDVRMESITRIIKDGYDVRLLNRGFRQLIEKLDLDFLFIDTHPGLNEETLLSIAMSDVLFIILRPDQQDFQGTSVTVEVAKRLKVEDIRLVVNMALPSHDSDEIRQKVEKIYQCPVAGVIPRDDAVAAEGSQRLHVKTQPDSDWSRAIAKIADELKG